MPTPHDSLPVYSARPYDPETTSVRSAAPSYTSAAPSYHSRGHSSSAGLGPPSVHPPSQNVRRPTGGDADNNTWRAARTKLGGVDVRAYNIPSWSSVQSSHQAKHYHSVAHRRAKAAVAAAAAAGGSGQALVKEPLRMQPPAICGKDILEEDPYLVGGEAAERARKERLTKQRTDEALIQEDKAWDFMIRQMADWEARDRSWTKFRRESERKGVLRSRFAMFGTGRW